MFVTTSSRKKLTKNNLDDDGHTAFPYQEVKSTGRWFQSCLIQKPNDVIAIFPSFFSIMFRVGFVLRLSQDHCCK